MKFLYFIIYQVLSVWFSYGLLYIYLQIFEQTNVVLLYIISMMVIVSDQNFWGWSQNLANTVLRVQLILSSGLSTRTFCFKFCFWQWFAIINGIIFQLLWLFFLSHIAVSVHCVWILYSPLHSVKAGLVIQWCRARPRAVQLFIVAVSASCCGC